MGHVSSDMDSLDKAWVSIPNSEFQLGHVSSDMDRGASPTIREELIKCVSIGPRLFRHG